MLPSGCNDHNVTKIVRSLNVCNVFMEHKLSSDRRSVGIYSWKSLSKSIVLFVWYYSTHSRLSESRQNPCPKRTVHMIPELMAIIWYSILLFDKKVRVTESHSVDSGMDIWTQFSQRNFILYPKRTGLI